MRTLLLTVLMWLAGSVHAQTTATLRTNFGTVSEKTVIQKLATVHNGRWHTSRDTNLPTGSQFAESISLLSLEERERAVIKQLDDENIPQFFRRHCLISVTNVWEGKTNVGKFFVTPDYFAIGSDDDYLLMPVSPATAQHVADKLNHVLPTKKMVDAIYAAADVKLTPSPIAPTSAMTTVPIFSEHNELVRTQRMALTNQFPLGALTAGHKKDLVITARLATTTNKVAIYGWHRTNGAAIQPLYLGHVSWWVDYSQCIRLVAQTMLVNGEKKTVAEVLADPKLCGLISDEGVVTNARYPTNLLAPPVAAAKINLPWPQKFTTSPNFGEWTREIKLPDEVRIVINAPAKEQFATHKPVLLVFYALPNGNTIEQTIGKSSEVEEDWHYDIQHIGAQTRWLRNVITNKTIVVAYLEAGKKSWPAWRKEHSDRRIGEILDDLRGIFSANQTEVVLASHSGGGSFMFGYLNAVKEIPSDVKRITFLDSNYAYNRTNHADKFQSWLKRSPENYLCVLAYQDYLGLLEGKPFVSEAGGTWGRSRMMLDDLGKQFLFTSTTNGGLEHFSAANGQMEFLLKENPEHKVFHTLQVEQNGFIHALLSGTPDASKGYEYFGERAYTSWIR